MPVVARLGINLENRRMFISKTKEQFKEGLILAVH